jgi:hypothetical protein
VAVPQGLRLMNMANEEGLLQPQASSVQVAINYGGFLFKFANPKQIIA